MRVKYKKVPYIYKEYEKVIKLREKKSHTEKLTLSTPKMAIF